VALASLSDINVSPVVYPPVLDEQIDKFVGEATIHKYTPVSSEYSGI